MSVLLQMSGPVVDMIYSVRALPASGLEADVTGFSVAAGGGLNAMAAARAAGMEVRFGGTIGSGPMADIVKKNLEQLGITCARLPLERMDQGCCTVLLEPNGERTFVGYPGAEGQISIDDLADIALEDVSSVLCSGYTLHYPGARNALANWIASLPDKITVFFDPSPLVDRLDRDILEPVLKRADWVSANQMEAETLTGQSAPDAGARALACGRQGAVLRRGPEGAVLATQNTVQEIAAHTVSPVDTNGAGDCHIGSFIAKLSQTGDAVAAARYASIAAALSTTHYGPATPPKSSEVEILL